MNQLLLRVCVGLLLLPVLLVVALWLGMPWRAICWAVCGVGVLWCAYTAWGQVRRKGGGLTAWLFPAALIQTGLWGLAIALTAETDTTADRALIDAVGTASGIAIFVLLLTGLVGFGGLAVRMLRSNQAVQLQPRRAMWGGVLLACNAVGWAFVISISPDLARQKSNLSVVNYLAANDLQVFTRGRYARELLGNHYIWMDDPATPPLGWWPFAGAMADPDDVIRKYVHSKDRFSGAYELTDERRENERVSKKRAFGVTISDAVEAFEVAPSAKEPQSLRRITDVKLGSPAERSGVQRGDALVAVNGMPLAQWIAKESSPVSSVTSTTAHKSTPSVATAPNSVGGDAKPIELITSLGVRTRVGALITLGQRATFSATGVQQVAWLERGSALYIRLDSFEKDTAIYLIKAIKDLEVSGTRRLLDFYVPVIDLRGNPGGHLYAAEEIGRALFGRGLAAKPVDRQISSAKPEPSLAGTDASERLIHTRDVSQPGASELRSYNWTIDKNNGATQTAKGRSLGPILPYMPYVLLLTDSGTCSAAEYLIHGLRQLADIKVLTFGQTTCGKPYGFQQREYAGYRFTVVDSVHLTSQGQVAYPSGIVPTCKVIDPASVPFAAPGDTVFEGAMFYAENLRCP